MKLRRDCWKNEEEVEVLGDVVPLEAQEDRDRVAQGWDYLWRSLCIITEMIAALLLRSLLHVAVVDITAVDRHPHIKLGSDHLQVWHRML